MGENTEEKRTEPVTEGGPRIGADEWVARSGERITGPTGWAGQLTRVLDRVPPAAQLAVVVGLTACIPFVTDNDYVVRVALNTVLFGLLALGLNIAVGWAGLLDLGYIAFYGFGAYAYAILSSEQFGLHWPTALTVPVVVVASAFLGLLLGLPSRRLVGDYLAIVTLFFLQIFVVLTNNADRITLPWNDSPTDFTGGPNGITGLDPMRLFGIDFGSTQSYLWLSLGVFTLVIVSLNLLNESRTGRAWRASREDSLAAELMSIPVHRMKLLAFAFGAATAGLTGTIFAAVQVGVFPGNFDVPLLITVYAMVILGGAGSLPGVVLGAVVINVSLELLRDPSDARKLFYGAILVALIGFVRPWRTVGIILGGTIVFGIVAYQLADWLRPEWVSGSIEGGRLASLLEGWVIHPAYPTRLGNIGFVLLIAAVITLSQLRGLRRTLLTIPTLYLAACVWENRLVVEPSVTRILLLGALLIVLMIARPQGLLGTPRVEV